MENKKNRREDTKSLVRSIERIFEVIVLSVLYYFLWRNYYGYDGGPFPDYYYNGKYVLAGVYALLLVLVFNNLDCFKFGHLRSLDIGLGQGIALVMVNFITYFQLSLIANKLISPLPMLGLTGVQLVVAIFLIFIYSRIYHKLYAPHNMVLIYGTDNAVGLKIKMDARRDKYNITKLIDANEDFDKICTEIVKYDAIVINDLEPQRRNDILKFCYKNQLRVYAVPKISDIIVRGGKEVKLFDTPLLLLKGTGISLAQRFWKRLMDIVLSLIVTVIASPIMLTVALAIKIEDRGPVFYKQKRLTLNGREFEILKFRSMVTDAEKYTGVVLATGNDPRITKVGKFIRATRLDELPQVLNILKGDMSVVGPRPERQVFVDEFCKDMPEFVYRMKVKGGLTGYAQIYGKYNTSPYDKLRLDMMYIENYSLLLDIKLIILTIRIMFSKDSTEGIDVAKQNESLKNELLEEIRQENGDNPEN